MWKTNFSTDTLKNLLFDRNYIGRPQKLKLFSKNFQQANTEYHKVYELRKIVMNLKTVGHFYKESQNEI